MKETNWVFIFCFFTICSFALGFKTNPTGSTECNENFPGCVELKNSDLHVIYDYEYSFNQECPFCYNYGRTGKPFDEFGIPIYRNVWLGARELDAQREECCFVGCSFDPTGSNCEERVISVWGRNDISNDTTTPNTVVWRGISEKDDLIEDPIIKCTPPGIIANSQFCVNTVTTDILHQEAKIVEVNSLENISIPENTIQSTIRISNWTFATGSSGIRIFLILSMENSRVQEYTIYPNMDNNENPFESILLSAFDTNPYNGTISRVRILSEMENEVWLSQTCVVDGVATPVEIEGPDAIGGEPTARLFGVDVPLFSDYVEYTIFARVIPQDESRANSGQKDDDDDLLGIPLPLFIVVVIVVAIVLCLSLAIGRKVHQLKRRKHRKKKHMKSHKRDTESSSSSDSSDSD